MSRQAAEQRGHWGETLGCWWLRFIARRGRTLAFVEVKTRQKAADLDLAIDRHRLRRVAAATQVLVPHFARPDDDVRLDVLLLAPFSWPRHVQNVWHG
ncbi:MAG: hypothetical protein EBT84_04560 [Sphingomonadaceae bacterium]|nr:hypothetical protein [Sphingomonadaceae bacterium]